MAETPAGLLARLEALGIETTTTTHAPVFTVAESQALRGTLRGGHSKNLFLRPAKAAPGPHLLAVLEENRQISVNALARAAGAVRIVLDAGLLREHDWVHFHPLVNSMTTAIRPADLLRFLASLGHRPEVLELPAATG
jgi:Ala-tRNA(Pro) deacylase